MSEEELEKTGMISKIMADEEETVEEKVEEILDKLEYNDYPIWKKNRVNDLIDEIQSSKKQNEKEKKFYELIELMDSE